MFAREIGGIRRVKGGASRSSRPLTDYHRRFIISRQGGRLCVAFVSLATAVPAAALGSFCFVPFLRAGGHVAPVAPPLLLRCLCFSAAAAQLTGCALQNSTSVLYGCVRPALLGSLRAPFVALRAGAQCSQTKPEFCIIAPRLVRFAVRFWLRLCLWLPPCLLPRWVSFRFVLSLSGGRGTLRPAHRPWLLRCLCWGFARCGSRSPCRAALKLGRSGGRKRVGALCRSLVRCVCYMLPLSILIL